MKYNTLGKTGLQVSALGLGGHEFEWSFSGNVKNSRMTSFDPDRTAVIEKAFEGGVNYFDTTFFEEVQSLGHQIEKLNCRDQMVINGMVIDTARRSQAVRDEGGDVEKFIRDEVDTRLELLRSDHFDLFMLCNISRDYTSEILSELIGIYQKLQQEGKFRFIGASCHDFKILHDFAQLDLPIDAVMFWYSYPTGTRQPVRGHTDFEVEWVDAALRTIDEKTIGKVAMKPLTWFWRALPFHLHGPAEDETAACQSSVAWQTQKGEVHTSVLAVDSSTQMEQNLSAVNSLPDEDLLQSYIARGHDLLPLLDRGDELPPYRRDWVAIACKAKLQIDLGDDPAAYRQHVLDASNVSVI